jgi:N-acetylglucosaminyl-diphospho-decaprenol L-rhamnosyltransferase
MTTRVSAIVVTWNSVAVVSDCLASLQAALPDGAQIVVVDNASSDGTVAAVRLGSPEAVVIENATNRGLAAANNQGMARADGETFLICNPDTVFRPEAVRAMVAVLDAQLRAAWVVPRLVDVDGTLLTSAGDLPRVRDALWGRLVAWRKRSGSPEGFWWDGWDHRMTRQIGRGHECAYIVRRAAVEEVGPQDERYVLDWEGIDWTERLRRSGWEVWLCAEAEVVHLGGASVRQVPLRAVVSQHKGMWRYFADRCRPAWVWKPLLVVMFGARALVKLAVTAVGVPLYGWAHRGRRGGPAAGGEIGRAQGPG